MLLDDVRQTGRGQFDDLKLYSAVVEKKSRILELCFSTKQDLTEQQKQQIEIGRASCRERV